MRGGRATEIARRGKAACNMARDAGLATLRYYQSESLQVEFKSDRSPVTLADREAERLLRDAILAEFPHDAVLGEELGGIEGQNDFRWVLDPIDGTKSFVAGVPLYGTMVGLECEGQAVAGVLYFPALDEMAFGWEGTSAWMTRGDGLARPARVARKSRLEDCTLMLTDAKSFATRGAADAIRALELRTRFTRTWGDCYGYYLVATGRGDIMIDAVLNVWDAVAVQPIIEAAGGTFCDWTGQAKSDSGHALAANPELARDVLEYLSPTVAVGHCAKPSA